jgi:pimeloyl-ACP methyl ester carboxylesterase
MKSMEILQITSMCYSYMDLETHLLPGASDIPDALSKYFHTITVDLIGFGESDKPEKPDYYYTIKGFSKFIVDFLERIGIKEEDNKEHQHNNNKKINIVGYSLGYHIAAKVTIENKKR